MRIENKLAELGFVLPPAPEPQPGFQFAFEWARVRGNRVYLSGHAAQNPDGTLAGPFGKVPSQVSVDDACDAARSAALSMIASVARAVGDLDRVTAWLNVSGMVNADSGFHHSTVVLNSFSDLILCVFGPQIGAHARTAVGVQSLPLDNVVIVAAEIEIDGDVP
ncbi:RidA family protein [Antrihabitans sp. YC3-6]|uniref:RidA family protein n=1 Tax=Antrihabitans stalagmiti TaxID=2799499 RepID=A0A934U4Y7_9NOCA|nr:RidA family protein [Antrihabitans stalagmiti]MBJ8340995.1 RidA family protein [Antrihabitans stalagmiti]